MTVRIYNTPTPAEHLMKDIAGELTPAAGIAGKLRGEVSVDRPVITVEGTWNVGNYAYIPDFARYYYIVNRDLMTKDLTVLYLESDPLMSFASSIGSLSIQVLRTEKKADEGTTAGYDVYIADPKMQTEARKIYIRYEDPSFDFSYPDEPNAATYQYVLGVIG